MNQVSGQFFASVMSPNLACEQALLFGRAKRAARERASERRSHNRNTKLQSRLAFGECRTSNDSKVSD